jgi:hypothetical protein
MRKHPFKVRSKLSWKIVHSDLLYQYPSDYGSVVMGIELVLLSSCTQS